MPRIDSAMVASLRSTVARDLASDASNVKNSFSSWDNCMNATYCKWPVIAAIIVGGLIVLSVVWCIARCACCGLSCCCSCFSCFKCCGNCCGCCDPPGGRKTKYQDDPHYPPAQGYMAPPAMMTGAAGSIPFDPPKFAHFETGPNGMAVTPAKMVSDDALPPMPSWDSAAKKHILTTEERDAVELGELDPATGQKIPLMTAAGGISRTGSPNINAPHTPYEDMNGGTHSPYMGAGAGAAAGAAAMGARGGYGKGNGRGYSPGPNSAVSPISSRGQGYGADPYNHPNNSTSPISGRGQGYGSDPYNHPNTSTSPISGRGQGYSTDPYNQYPEDNYHENNNYNNNPSPAPFVAAAYPRAQPQRQFSDSNSSYSPQPYQPSGPQRQYSNESSNRPLVGNNGSGGRPYPPPANDLYSQRRPSPPTTNSGFDYNHTPAAYHGADLGSRTRSPPQQQQQQGYTSSLAPTYATRDPAPQAEYRAYGGGRGVAPGATEEDRWGPV